MILWTPFKRCRTRLSHGQKPVNRHYPKIRALGEHAVATLKTWKVLTRLQADQPKPSTQASISDVP
jgi:hypothetical protein